jgi:hypothetical protein
LSVRDLLRCTLISREWNEIIGQSPNVMSKFWLRFYDPVEKNIKSLLESSRHYTNFKCQFNLPPKFLLDKFKWKKVMLRDFSIDYEQFIQLMKFISPTVENIDLWDIDIECKNNNFIHLDFPRLKTLELNLSHRSVIHTFLGSNPILKALIIRNESAKFLDVEQQMMKPTNIIQEIVKRNKIEKIKLLYCEFALNYELEGLLKSKNLKI